MDYLHIAMLEGYELVFVDLGMAYVKYESIMLTEIMDKEDAERIMQEIGLAISADWTRQYIAHLKSEG